MTQIVESLFGVNPERYQQQQDAALQQEALAYARLDPLQRAEAGIYAGARGLASGIGRMLGGEDPGMRRVTEQDQIIRSIDLNNPETYGPAAQRALQTGHSELAQKIMNRYSQLQESSALIGQRKAAAVASGAAAQQSAAQTSKIELSVEQETRLRNELNKLPANATEADIRGVLIKYGDPDKVIVALTSAAKSETDKAIRLEKIEADKISRQDKLEADRVALQDKLESRLTTEREKIEARKELEQNRQETQKLIEQNRLDAQAAQKEADRTLREQLAKDRADSEERMAKDRNAAKNAQLEFQKQALQDRLDLQKQLAQDKIDAQVAAAKDRGATAKEIAAIAQQGKVEIAKLMIQGKTDMATLAASLKQNAQTGKPLPASLQKEEGADLVAIDNLTAQQEALKPAIANLTPNAQGVRKLELGPVNNLKYAALNAAGRSTPESRAFESLKSAVDTARNLQVSAEKGVQTDRDVLRFSEALIAAYGRNDSQATFEALTRYRDAIAKSTDRTQTRLESRRKSQNVEPYGFKTGAALGTPENPIKLD